MGLELLAPTVPATPEGWATYVHQQVTSGEETVRRSAAAERVKLYRDDYQSIISNRLQRIFSPAVYKRMEPLIPLIGGTSFLKRVADELGRPLYARAPIRRIMLPGDKAMRAAETAAAQEAYAAICDEACVNACQDTAVRLLIACTAVFEFVRYIESMQCICIDIVTPDMLSVIPHPDVRTMPLAIAYVVKWQDGKPFEHVVWDDQRYFSLGPNGNLLGAVTPHDLGMLPWVDIHLRGRTGEYWQPTVGNDIVSQDEQSKLFDLIDVRKVKSQSHRQLSYVGDSDAFIKGQVLDDESVIHADGGTIATLDFESDPTKITETKLANEAAVAANWGISRDRLNQKVTTGSDDVGLHERVAELAAVMVPAEKRLFQVIKRVAREHPGYRGMIPDDAMLMVDLGQLFNRVDRKTQLDIRDKERSMGCRSGVDDVLEDNPEFGGDREMAMEYIDEKMAEEAVIVARRRALNAPAGGSTPEEPGQMAEQNGAMGPMVRDGAMTKDQAAEMAAKGPPPAEMPDTDMAEIAREVLYGA